MYDLNLSRISFKSKKHEEWPCQNNKLNVAINRASSPYTKINFQWSRPKFFMMFTVWSSLNFDLHSRESKKKTLRKQANTSTCARPYVIGGDLLLLNTALKGHVTLTGVSFSIWSTDGIFHPSIEEAAQPVTVTLCSSLCVYTVRPEPTLMAQTHVTPPSYNVLTSHCKTWSQGWYTLSYQTSCTQYDLQFSCYKL